MSSFPWQMMAGCRGDRPGGGSPAVFRSGAPSGTAHPNISLVRRETTELPSPAVIATGPLTSDRLSQAIGNRLGAAALSFYDAIAPIVSGESLEHRRLYALSRYGKGQGDDYLNAPMDFDAVSAIHRRVARGRSVRGA